MVKKCLVAAIYGLSLIVGPAHAHGPENSPDIVQPAPEKPSSEEITHQAPQGPNGCHEDGSGGYHCH